MNADRDRYRGSAADECVYERAPKRPLSATAIGSAASAVFDQELLKNEVTAPKAIDNAIVNFVRITAGDGKPAANPPM